jgi:16S rRNA (guanine1207-N2)-methyltransferase
MAEQAFHVLRPRGRFVVLSPYEKDALFPGLLKKGFGSVHATSAEVRRSASDKERRPTSHHATVFWCQREGDKPRRRHEVTFQARVGDGIALRFLSRPGVFSYGRFDEGARALVETMRIDRGDRIVDLGCGCGANGIFAGSRCAGHVVFVDSNLRAVALAEHNARANGLTDFAVQGSSHVEGLREQSFDVVLTNPPYYASGGIAQLFIESSLALLRPGGKLYLVTKQADQVGPLMAASFGRADIIERRGYAVLCATAPAQFFTKS